ncbi:MAG: response regulator transcription factor [Ardenticatenaceae bacterium]|nr:response regulator transcription factor [Ardenticatenaceae bacterium]
MSEFEPGDYRILVIDDDTLILELIEESLTRSGFQVSTVTSAEDALDWMKRYGMPHLAVVDINMPFGMDGLEFCEVVHTFSDLPIMMLTAIEDEETIIQAIDRCAEDYLTKPFQPGELIARARRIIRSIGHFAFPLEAMIHVDERLAIDLAGCQVIVDGRPEALTPTETKLLYILLRSAGKPVNSNYLLRRLWPHDVDHDDRLRVYVHRLRNKLEINPAKPHYIRSQRGVGYVFHDA